MKTPAAKPVASPAGNATARRAVHMGRDAAARLQDELGLALVVVTHTAGVAAFLCEQTVKVGARE